MDWVGLGERGGGGGERGGMDGWGEGSGRRRFSILGIMGEGIANVVKCCTSFRI